MKDFYERFETLLARRKINKNQFSKITGISTGNIANWKRGDSVPSAKSLIIMSDFFQVPIEWLLRGDDAALPKDLDSKIVLLLDQYRGLPPEKQKKIRFMFKTALNALDDE